MNIAPISAQFPPTTLTSSLASQSDPRVNRNHVITSSNNAPLSIESLPSNPKVTSKKNDWLETSFLASGVLKTILDLAGAFLLIGTILAGAKNGNNAPLLSRNLGNFFARRFGLSPERFSKVNQKAHNLGNVLLAITVLFRSWRGIGNGIADSQPSMIIGNLSQLALIPLILKRFPLALSLDVLLGGLFTLGFANAVDNKAHPEQPKRIYDMSEFLRVIDLHSSLNPLERLGSLLKETLGMILFTLGDMKVALERLLKEAGHLLKGEPSDLFDFSGGESSASKSSLGWLLSTVATLPQLLASTFGIGSRLMATRWFTIYNTIVLLTAGVFNTLALFLIGLARKDAIGGTIMAGTTLEIGSYLVESLLVKTRCTGLPTAISRIGEALQNIVWTFFATNGGLTLNSENSNTKQG